MAGAVQIWVDSATCVLFRLVDRNWRPAKSRVNAACDSFVVPKCRKNTCECCAQEGWEAQWEIRGWTQEKQAVGWLCFSWWWGSPGIYKPQERQILVLSDLVEHTYSDLISNRNRTKETFGVETGKTQSKRVHTSSSPLRYCLHFSLYTGSFRIVFCTHWGGALDLFETHCFPELLLLFVALICGLAIFNSGAEGSSEWLWDSQKSLTLKVLSLGT